MTSEKVLVKFRAHMQKSQLSPLTIKTYYHAANTFLNKYKKVSAANIMDFQRYLEMNYCSRSFNVYVIGFNHFLRFIKKPEFQLRVTKCGQKSFLDDVISYEDYLHIKKKLSELNDLRTYFIIWTLAATGVRISELIQFCVEDIRRGFIDVRAKGNKERRIFIPCQLQTEILAWLDERGVTSGAVFRTVRDRPISIRGITKGLEKTARTLGINPHKIHPHTFRHLFAKMFLAKSNDIAMLCDLLGHESLDTTKIYLRKTSHEQKTLIDNIVEW